MINIMVRNQVKIQIRIIAATVAKSLLIILLSYSHAMSMPGWAKKAAKKANKIEIDQRAKYLELLNKMEIEYFVEGRSVIKVRRAYKILSVNGADDFIFLEPTTPKRKITNFSSWTKSPSGKEKVQESDAIHFVPVTHEATTYMDIRYAYFPYEDLQAGSIIAQEYEITDSDISSFISDYHFQIQQPVLDVELRARAPKGWELFASGLWTEKLDFKRDGQWYIWTGSNYPFQPDEPLMPDWRYLTKQIGITCFNPDADSAELYSKQYGLLNTGQFQGWNSVSRWVESIYNPFAKPDSTISDIVDSLSALSESRTELVTKIAQYVSQQIRYVSVSLGDGRFVPHAVDETLKNGYGDCKDKTTLTRAMLAAAGVPSVAALTSVKSFVNPNLPNPYQFDHCIVGVPLNDSLEFTPHANVDGREWLFIDPTDYVTPVGALPPQLMGGTALIANQDDSTLIHLPYTEANSWRRKNVVSAEIGADGSISAKITIIEYGAYAWNLGAIVENQSNSTIKRQWSDEVKLKAPKLEMSEFTCDCSPDSCVTSFLLVGKKYAMKAGEELICKVNPYEFVSPRELSANTRTHPIWFGPPSSTETIVTWMIPETAVVSLSIDSLSLESTPGKVKVSFVNLDSNSIEFRSYIEISGALLNADDYTEAQEFDATLSGSVGLIFGLKLPNANEAH